MGQSSLRGAEDKSVAKALVQRVEAVSPLNSSSSPSNSMPKSQEDRSVRSRIQDERSKEAMANECCNFISLSDLTDRSILNAATGKSMGTDMCSLLDVNGDGRVDCVEILSAICMVPPVYRSDNDVSTMEGGNFLNVNHRRDDAEVQPRPMAAPFQVPLEFKGVSYDWTAHSGNQAAPSPRQQARLQNCMKPFLQSMLVGALVRLRLEPGEAPDCDPSGQSIDATISLNDDFSVLFIAAGSAQRSVSVKAIRLVRPPEKAKDSDRCADLRLAGGRFVRFHFDTEAQAKFFGTCMRLLVKASCSGMSTSSANTHAA